MCRHQLDLLHPVELQSQRRRNEELLADHEIGSLVVPTAYGTVIESVQLVDEMGIYMEAHEGMLRRGEGRDYGPGFRVAGFET